MKVVQAAANNRAGDRIAQSVINERIKTVSAQLNDATKQLGRA